MEGGRRSARAHVLTDKHSLIHSIVLLDYPLDCGRMASDIHSQPTIKLLYTARGICCMFNNLLLQGLAKERCLGCVKRTPAAIGDQDARITQPRDHSLAYPSIFSVNEVDKWSLRH